MRKGRFLHAAPPELGVIYKHVAPTALGHVPSEVVVRLEWFRKYGAALCELPRRCKNSVGENICEKTGAAKPFPRNKNALAGICERRVLAPSRPACVLHNLFRSHGTARLSGPLSQISWRLLRPSDRGYIALRNYTTNSIISETSVFVANSCTTTFA